MGMRGERERETISLVRLAVRTTLHAVVGYVFFKVASLSFLVLSVSMATTCGVEDITDS